MAGDPDDIDRGRAALLETFRWHDGHADVWRVFRDARALRQVVRGLVAPFHDSRLTAVAGIEARGFLLGGAAAVHLGVGFIAVRKSGALFPGPKARQKTGRDYRGNHHELLLQRDSVTPGDRVLLVDDWAETGSQARAVQHLLHACGAELTGVSVMVDQLDPATRQALGTVAALTTYADLPGPE